MSGEELRVSRWAAGQLVVLGLFLVVHTGSFIWWAGRVSAEVRTLKEQVRMALVDPYQSADAERDVGRVERRVEALAEQLESDRLWTREYEQRLSRLEAGTVNGGLSHGER